MTFDATDALITYLKANINMANVTALSTRPVIIYRSQTPNDDGDGAIASGELRFNDEFMREEPQTKDLSDEIYIIEATYHIQAQTSMTNFQEVLAEIKRVLRVANQAAARAYVYEMEAEFDLNPFHPIADITFTLTKEDVDVST